MKEAVDFLTRKFARETAEQGTDVLTRRVGALAAKHGDPALRAFQQVGPRVFRLAADAGKRADVAVLSLAERVADARSPT